jgi:hypothetical protein
MNILEGTRALARESDMDFKLMSAADKIALMRVVSQCEIAESLCSIARSLASIEHNGSRVAISGDRDKSPVVVAKA